MKVSRKLLRFTKGWEGFSSCPYWDALGNAWTIGYGDTEDIGPNTPCWSKRKASRRLKRRINSDYARPAWLLVRPELRQREMDAIADFVYNVGLWNFHDSTLLRRLNSREGQTHENRRRIYREELRRWVYDANGVEQLGLVKRRRAETHLANYGDYSGRP